MAIAAYTPTKSYSDNTVFSEKKFSAFVDGLETYLNDNLAGKCPDKTGSEIITGAWIFTNAVTFSAVLVEGNLTVASTLSVTGNVSFSGPSYIEHLIRNTKDKLGVYNMGFKQGATTSTLTICAADGSNLSTTNPLYLVVPNENVGSIDVFEITSNISINLQGAHWGWNTFGDTNDVILRVYVCVDGTNTPRFGVGILGGVTEIGTGNVVTLAASASDSRRLLVNGSITGSLAIEVGHIKADFDDTGNVGGENYWTITDYFPYISGDGYWSNYNLNGNNIQGFSASPTLTGQWTMIGKLCIYTISSSATGTSNSTAFTINCPVMADGTQVFPAQVTDNGSVSVVPGSVSTADASASLALGLVMSGPGGFTAANGKTAQFTIMYEAEYVV